MEAPEPPSPCRALESDRGVEGILAYDATPSSRRFSDLLKGLQEEHELLIHELARLRSQSSTQAWSSPHKFKEKSKSDCAKEKKRPSQLSKSVSSLELENTKKSSRMSLNGAKAEWKKQFATFTKVEDDDNKYSVPLGKRIFYAVENYSSLYENFFLMMLIFITVASTIFLGIFWKISTEDEMPDQSAFFYYYDMFQLIVNKKINYSLRNAGEIIVYTLAILVGMLVFAILIGIITEKFKNLVQSINKGTSSVPESGHTLLLGFNESTDRVCCQVAFLRRKYIMNNSSFMQRWLHIGRVPPATPVAAGRIVILCNNRTKAEMHERLQRAFEERGISSKRTRIGWDVICRVGDPTSPQDLIKAGAHRAVAIAVMMSEQDIAEEEAGGTANAATFRTVLALRNVLFAPEVKVPWNDIRIIVPLSRPSKAIHSVSFEAPPTEEDAYRQVILCQDLSIVLNTLMFTCCLQPGLGDVFMDLMNFDGVALRLRRVKDFPLKHQDDPIVGKTFAQMAHRWENAILVGVIPREFMNSARVDPENGIACKGSRVIKECDRLIFISEESLPRDVRVKPLRNDVDYTAKATPLEKRPKKSLLVCGFQRVWKDPERLAYRIFQTSNALADGSRIYFLNLLPTDEFLSYMDVVSNYLELRRDEASSDGSHRTVWILEDRITISFTEGDPANYDTLECVMKEQDGFEVALVVPPVNTAMSAQAQDTRLMTIMCTLRTICENNKLPPIHVVGENKLESSAGLALRPKVGDESIDETDFVNSQAIIARAQCQAMAFPYMQPAMVQLFDSTEGTPSIFIVQAELFVPLDYEISFADVFEEVKEECKDHICIGYRRMLEDSVKQVLCPKPDERVRFKELDTLVIISRRQPGTRTSTTKPPKFPHAAQKVARETENAGTEISEFVGVVPDTESFLPRAIYS